MARDILVVAVAVLVGVASPWRVAGAAEPGDAARADLVSEVQDVLDAYLMQNCASADENPAAALEAVLGLSSVAVPELLSIVEWGPSKRTIREVENVARADFRSLGKGRRRSLRLDEQGYVDMRVRGSSEAYRERALNALLATGDAAVVQSLSRIAVRGAVGDEFMRSVAKAVQATR